MNPSEIGNVFGKELGLIILDDVVMFTVNCLEKAPDYFWTVPTSSTGKYHPTWANGKGGLILHTKVVVRYIYQLYRAIIGDEKYNGCKYDLCISAAILHDIAKNGLRGSKFTIPDHGEVAASIIRDVWMDDRSIPWEFFIEIHEAVRLHYGRWNERINTPMDLSAISLVVHLADMVATDRSLPCPISGD